MINTAIVLAGGLGTRMGPLTAHCPKPLLPIRAKHSATIIDLVLDFLVEEGFSRILVAVSKNEYSRFVSTLGHARYRAPHRLASVEYMAKPASLETAASVVCALRHLQTPTEPAVVLNGDTLLAGRKTNIRALPPMPTWYVLPARACFGSYAYETVSRNADAVSTGVLSFPSCGDAAQTLLEAIPHLHKSSVGSAMQAHGQHRYCELTGISSMLDVGTPQQYLEALPKFLRKHGHELTLD